MEVLRSGAHVVPVTPFTELYLKINPYSPNSELISENALFEAVKMFG